MDQTNSGQDCYLNDIKIKEEMADDPMEGPSNMIYEIKEEIKDEEYIEIKQEIIDEDYNQEYFGIKAEDVDIKDEIICDIKEDLTLIDEARAMCKTDKDQKFKKRRVYRNKKWFCIYCEKFVICFPRHLLVHSNEPDVIDLINTPRGDEKNRKVRILKGRGALYVNSTILFENKLLVGKNAPRSGPNYEPCPACGIFYSPPFLRTHYKNCTKSDNVNLPLNSKKYLQKSNDYPIEPTSYLKYVVFAELENNKVTEIIVNDPLIISFGNHLTEGKFRRQIKGKLQLIASLFLKVKELEPNVNCINDLYNLDHWEKLVGAVKFIADTNKKQVGSVSRLLLNIAKLEESRSKMHGDTETFNKFSSWLKVYQSSNIECENKTPLLNKNVTQIQEKSLHETSGRKQQRFICIYCKKLRDNLSRHLFTHHASEMEVKEILALPKNSTMRLRKLSRLKRKGNVPYVCLFCKKITKCFPKHVYSCHSSNKEVQKVLAMPKNSIERLRKLRRMRTFQPNLSCLISNQSLGKRGSVRKYIKRHLLCPYCKTFLRASDMFRHIKCFNLRVSYARKALNQRNSILLPRKIHYNSKHYDVEPAQFLKDKIYPNLKPDNITDLISTDPLLITFGNALCKNKVKVNHIKIRLRRVAIVLDKMKDLTSEVERLQDIFNPNLYDLFTISVKLISRIKGCNSAYIMRLTGPLLKFIARNESFRCQKEGEMEKSNLISAWINKLVSDPLFKLHKIRNGNSPTVRTESISHSSISLVSTNNFKSSTPSSEKTKIRNKWKDEEKEVLKDMISTVIKRNKLPSHSEIRKLKDKFPILQNRTVLQIYAYINNVCKVHLKSPKNDQKSDTGNSSMGEETNSIDPFETHNKSLQRKVPWDSYEKETVQNLVFSAIEHKKLPPISQIRQLKDTSPALKNRTVKQIYAYINNVYRKHLENPQLNEENQYEAIDKDAENLQTSNSCTTGLSRHKTFHNKTYWSYGEKLALHSTISTCLKNNKLPSKSDLLKVKTENPILNYRTVTQMYAYVNNIYRKYLNRRTNEDYISSDSDVDTKTEDLILRTHTTYVHWSEEERQVLEETICRSITEKKLPHMSEIKALKEQHSSILVNRSAQQMYAYVNNTFRKYHLKSLEN